MVTISHPTILLLEDEALIAVDIEKILGDAQAGRVVTLASCVAALNWLSDNTPDAAIIDIFLRDGECAEVAETLVARGVPFIVHSARRKAAGESHRIFLHGEWICKPSDPDELVGALKACLRPERPSYGPETPARCSAYSDEAGHRFRFEAGQSFRFHSGRRSDLKAAISRTDPGSV